jgi:hypothetical protein
VPTHQVNLDALILRQPFPPDDTFSGKNPSLKLEELHRGRMFFQVLRKPEFQRDTSNWSPDMIYEFVRTFLDGGLIPAVIMWHSKNTNNTYIIDGAHRLSALIAYANDDYGDGEISRKAWGDSVPRAQAKLHLTTKTLIDNRIGSFAQLSGIAMDLALTDDPVKRRRAGAITTIPLPIQTVDGDTQLAEESFYRINSSAVEIDPTELDVIRARNKPNAIATRAIIFAGKGHRYWQQLPNAAEIEKKANDVHKLLFGDLGEIGPQSPDIPRGGQPYSNDAFKMVLDIVNVFNDISPAMWSHRYAESPIRKKKVASVVELGDDADGTATMAFLKNIETIARLAVGPAEHPESLGLEQGIYSYGNSGRFIPAAYIASFRFAQELTQNKQLIAFTLVRSKFEDFLYNHKGLLNLLTHSKGSRTRSLESILKLHRTVFDAMRDGKTDDEIMSTLEADPTFKGISNMVASGEDSQPQRKRFSPTAVRAKVIDELVRSRSRCTVCGARLPPSARSKDHATKVEQGGLGTFDNLNFTHPYCNSARDSIEAAKSPHV